MTKRDQEIAAQVRRALVEKEERKTRRRQLRIQNGQVAPRQMTLRELRAYGVGHTAALFGANTGRWSTTPNFTEVDHEGKKS